MIIFSAKTGTAGTPPTATGNCKRPDRPAWLLSGLLALLTGLPAQAAPAAPAADEFLYTVRSGDSAWNIADRYLRHRQHWIDLRRVNHLQNDRLVPGTVLRIPMSWLRVSTQEVRLISVNGDVALQRPGQGAWEAAKADTVLAPGCGLRTSPGGSATLTMTDGTRVMVRPDSELRLMPIDMAVLDTLFPAAPASTANAANAANAASTAGASSASSATGAATEGRAAVRIELLRGGLENAVRPQTGPGQFEVRTPSAVTVVRGTEFRISADGPSSRAEVLHGLVGFSNDQGGVDLPQARGSVAERNVTPIPPVPLLAAPELEAVPSRMSAPRARMTRVPPVEGAVSYRVQWFSDEETPRLLAEDLSATPLLSARPMADGHYRVRMRAIDHHGLEGMSGEKPVVIAAPAQPRLVSKGTGADGSPSAVSSSGVPLLLQWQGVEGATGYRVQVSPDADFTVRVAEQVVSGTQWTLPALPTGNYHWRVAAIESAGDVGDPATTTIWPDSEAQGLAFAFRQPRLAPIAPGTHLTLQWQGEPPDGWVQVQVQRRHARDGREMLFDQRRRGTSIEIPAPREPGRYRARLRAVTADGVTHPWSAQDFSVTRHGELRP